ncbi:MAG: hypothetical protein KY432_08345 [Acidobacteria bacterium]|nr:hypothetical protein [Acidobacteriota bacterium]
MSTLGIVIMAFLLPTGIILLLLAVSKWGNTRRFLIVSSTAFFLLAAWNLVSVVSRLLERDFGVLFFIELLLMIGFAFQAVWIWRVDLDNGE